MSLQYENEEFYIDNVEPLTPKKEKHNFIKSKTASKLDKIKRKRSGYIAEKEIERKENTLLLTEGADKDIEKLRAMGLSHNIEEALNKKASDIIEQRMEEDYKSSDFYRLDDIKQLCLEYNLRFLHSKLFQGYVDDMLLNKIDEFAERNGYDMDLEKHRLSNNIKILAPVETFNLNNSYNIQKYNREPSKNKKHKVMVFYERDHNYYELIHEWGDDFSFFRKLISWGVSTKLRHSITRKFNITAIIYISIAIILSLSGFLYTVGIMGNLILIGLSFFIANWIYSGNPFKLKAGFYNGDYYVVEDLYESNAYRSKKWT